MPEGFYGPYGLSARDTAAYRYEAPYPKREHPARRHGFVEGARWEEAHGIGTRVREVVAALKTGAYMDGSNGPDAFASADEAIVWAIERLSPAQIADERAEATGLADARSGESDGGKDRAEPHEENKDA